MFNRLVLTLSISTFVTMTVFACWAGGTDFLLLVGEVVVRPAEVSLMMWSVGVLGCASVLVLVLVRHRVHREARHAYGVVLGGLVAVALVGTGTWCVGRAVVVSGFAALGQNAYTVLRAPDDEGCVVIAHETGELRSSYGDLYSVGPLGYAQPVGSWRANEIQLPIRDGSYSLQWNGDVGTLVLRSTRGIWPERLQLSCAA